VRAAQRNQALRRVLKARGASQHQAALKTRRRHGHLPARALFAQPVFGGDAHIVEENLGEARQPVQLRNGAHRNARQIERHQNEAEPPVALGIRIAAKHSEEPIGKSAPRGPGLLSVHNVVVAVAQRGRLNVRHIAARIRLAPALRPDFLAGSHLRQKARLLRRRSEFHNRRPEQKNAILVDALRRARAVILLFENQPLEEIRAAPAELHRPGHHGKAAAVELRLPFPVQPRALRRIKRGQRPGRHIRLQPFPRLTPKRPLPIGVAKLHAPAS